MFFLFAWSSPIFASITCEDSFVSAEVGNEKIQINSGAGGSVSGYQKAVYADQVSSDILVGKLIYGYSRTKGMLEVGTVLSVAAGKNGTFVVLDRGSSWQTPNRYVTVNITKQRFTLAAESALNSNGNIVDHLVLTSTERQALVDYFIVGKTINTYLRARDGELRLNGDQARKIHDSFVPINQTIDLLEQIFSRATLTNSAIQVFRGEVVPVGSRSFKVDEVLDVYPNYLSATIDLQSAIEFSGSNPAERMVWRISVPQGSKVIDLYQGMQADGRSRKFSEFLFPRRRKLKVLAIVLRPEYTEVSAEMLK